MGLGLDTRREVRDSEAAVLPLINIVFLLLAFFIIAGQLMHLPPFEVNPPTLGGDPIDMPPEVIIHMARDGTLAIDSRPTNRTRLEQRLGEMVGHGMNPRIQIIADGGVEANTVITLLTRMRAAGVETTDLTTRQP
ncbi:biopolymer transporter ExbD [Spiribacter sp. 221]|uniref:ExbD/TolR family protein n=1 Tax=Spiribacter onubensis TaxID=3122420 RepID=UPI00349F9AC2